MSRILTRIGKHGSIYTKEAPIGHRPLNGCMCQDGTCESCNRVVEAFEAMREALYWYVAGDAARGLSLSPYKQAGYNKARVALALADEVAS